MAKLSSVFALYTICGFPKVIQKCFCHLGLFALGERRFLTMLNIDDLFVKGTQGHSY